MPDAGTQDDAVKRSMQWAQLQLALIFLPVILLTLAQGQFIPEPAVLYAGLVATAGFTLVVAVFVVRLGLKLKGISRPVLIAMIVLVTAAVVFFALYFGSRAFVIGLPDIYTRLVGQPAFRQVTVLGWHPMHRSRQTYSCAGVSIAEVPDTIEELCLRRYVDPGTPLMLRGRRSVLGFHADTIN